MSKQNAVDLAAVARALIAKLPRMTLAAAVAEWNAAAPHLAFIGVPGRKAHLERSLTAMIADIEAEQEAQPEQDAAATRAAFGRLDLFAQWNAIDEAHTEALEMNRKFIRDNFEEKYTATMQYGEFDESEVAEALEENKRFDWLANRCGLFHASIKWVQVEMLNAAHSEALRIDAEQYAAPVTCSIFQRNDGVQMALDSSSDVRFIRTSKNGEWFKAGFRNTDMEGYQPVESDVLFTSMPSRTLSYSDGVMVVSEA